MKPLVFALVLCSATPVVAEAPAETLPDYATCMARAVNHFEMAFSRTGVANSPFDFEILTRRRVAYCGTVGIVRCDRSGDPFPCQYALAQEQEVLRDAVLAHVPPPEDITDDPVGFLPLYRQVWALAHGTSSGPDCAGANPAMAAWCVTHEASLNVGEAILLWQIARLLGAADPAVQAGWIDAPPPTRPVPRPTTQ